MARWVNVCVASSKSMVPQVEDPHSKFPETVTSAFAVGVVSNVPVAIVRLPRMVSVEVAGAHEPPEPLNVAWKNGELEAWIVFPVAVASNVTIPELCVNVPLFVQLPATVKLALEGACSVVPVFMVTSPPTSKIRLFVWSSTVSVEPPLLKVRLFETLVVPVPPDGNVIVPAVVLAANVRL